MIRQKNLSFDEENIDDQNQALSMLTIEEYRKLWLGDYCDVFKGITEKVSKWYKKEREIEKYELKNNGEKPSNYTIHDHHHCIAVENIIYALIPESCHKKLTPEERFCLLAAVWLHDIGMMPMIYNRVWAKPEDGGNKEGQGQKRPAAGKLGKKKPVDEQLLRDRHHLTACKFVAQNYKKCGLYGRVNGRDCSAARNAVIEVIKYHRRREDISRCREHLQVETGVNVRVRLLAAYLRLADAMHIDSSRAPDLKYAICLAYNIPNESKIHWLKSRMVQSVTPNLQRNRLELTFRSPSPDQIRELEITDYKFITDNMNYIKKLVSKDLQEELGSVMHVLAGGGVSTYLSIRTTEDVPIHDQQTLNDILSLYRYYDILSNPSASRLIEMTLSAVANIAGYHLSYHYLDTKDLTEGLARENNIAKYLVDVPEENIKAGLEDFLSQVEQNLLRQRPCHLGLSKLHDQLVKLKNQFHCFRKGGKEFFISEVWKLFKKSYERRGEVTKNAYMFFKNEEKVVNIAARPQEVYSPPYANGASGGRNDESIWASPLDDKDKINILLYGNSALVTKVLYGLRDCLILRGHFPDDHAQNGYEYYTYKRYRHYGKYHWHIYTGNINIIICDGQPKTQLIKGRVEYHDGLSYANRLFQRDFSNIIMVPDLIAGNLLRDRGLIDYVIVGANGLVSELERDCRKDYFKHSAGHHSLLDLVRAYRQESGGNSDSASPKVILVTTTDKWDEENLQDDGCTAGEARERRPADEKKHGALVEGIRFWDYGDKALRKQIWFSQPQDDEFKRLKDECLTVYNPRGDQIPVGHVDVIICDTGVYHKECGAGPEGGGEVNLSDFKLSYRYPREGGLGENRRDKAGDLYDALKIENGDLGEKRDDSCRLYREDQTDGEERSAVEKTDEPGLAEEDS